MINIIRSVPINHVSNLLSIHDDYGAARLFVRRYDPLSVKVGTLILIIVDDLNIAGRCVRHLCHQTGVMTHLRTYLITRYRDYFDLLSNDNRYYVLLFLVTSLDDNERGRVDAVNLNDRCVSFLYDRLVKGYRNRLIKTVRRNVIDLNVRLRTWYAHAFYSNRLNTDLTMRMTLNLCQDVRVVDVIARVTDLDDQGENTVVRLVAAAAVNAQGKLRAVLGGSS